MNLSKQHNISSLGSKNEISLILKSGIRVKTKFGPIFLYNAKKEENFKIIHLTMYGESINKVQEQLQKEKNHRTTKHWKVLPNFAHFLLHY